VIVGPEARRELDKACMGGRGWWNDAWWREAAASGLLHIANQSWDYNHAALPDFFSHGVPLGTFRSIATRELADAEIARAAEYLRVHAPNPGDTLFAYPYGESNEYLAGEYFPRFGARLGIVAAFTREPACFTAGAARWRIPRFVFGRDWKSPAELERILAGAAR